MQGINKQEKKGKISKAWPVVLCLLLAGGVFVFLLKVETRQLARYEKGNVVVAATQVAAKTEITEDNLTTFFAVEERYLSDVPEASYLKPKDLVGQYVLTGIDAGSVITKSMLGELGEDWGDAVQLSVNMETLEHSVAGTLRAGDEIDIYTVKIDEEKDVIVEKVLGSVMIERSYTGAGAPILKEDNSSIAKYITISVHKDAVETFYRALENRRIEIVKHPN